MKEILEHAIELLVNQIESVAQKHKQKKLVTVLNKFIKEVDIPDVLQEHNNLIKELITLHEKHHELPGAMLVSLINLNKYPTLSNLVLNSVKELFPYEEADSFIELLYSKVKAIKIRQSTSKLVEKFILLENLSDEDVLKLYENLIVNEYLELVNDREDLHTTIKFDPTNIDELLESLQLVTEEARNKLKIPSGYKLLDEHFLSGGFEAGRIYVWGAEPGRGKSTLMINFVKNFVKQSFSKTELQSDKPPCVIYVTLENDPAETFTRISRSLLQKQINTRNLTEEIIQEISNEFKKMKTNLVVHYMTPNSSFTDLVMFIDTIAEEHRIVSIVVDYLNLIRLDHGKNEERRHELGRVTFLLKLLGITHKCPVLSPTQLNTSAYNDPFSNRLVVPTMKSLDESRQTAQNADFVGLLFEYPKHLLPPDLTYMYGSEEWIILAINIDKNRDDPKGVVTAAYNLPTYTINFFDKSTNDILVSRFLQQVLKTPK